MRTSLQSYASELPAWKAFYMNKTVDFACYEMDCWTDTSPDLSQCMSLHEEFANSILFSQRKTLAFYQVRQLVVMILSWLTDQSWERTVFASGWYLVTESCVYSLARLHSWFSMSVLQSQILSDSYSSNTLFRCLTCHALYSYLKIVTLVVWGKSGPSGTLASVWPGWWTKQDPLVWCYLWCFAWPSQIHGMHLECPCLSSPASKATSLSQSQRYTRWCGHPSPLGLHSSSQAWHLHGSRYLQLSVIAICSYFSNDSEQSGLCALPSPVWQRLC